MADELVFTRVSDVDNSLDEAAAAMTKRLMEPFPKTAIKTRPGGGGVKLAYVATHTVIHRLIAATNNNFTIEVMSQSFDEKAEIISATVRLTIPLLGSREQIGVQTYSPSRKGSEDLYKGAISDAIKKAATLFGVALELYGEDYEKTAETKPSAEPMSPVRKNLMAALKKSAAVSKMSQADEMSAARFDGITFGFLTNDQMLEWTKELEAGRDVVSESKGVPSF